ncbi:ComEC/Rec2 family competence protein [Parasphaerochaeta coccoides]|uniref:Beta-lactamase domain protein n=1 Tax=Parasphaerochaeta coccoides (strain ATCC BAA-1237 / DSM 17374 / SPN1) TaxID=760011 RepID=F4GJ87_PARC1|nr:MBL fold metallo-hydrolase [Parasphaerochaeta coccoides]AEC01727.1 beta-lactamase domain protein [Parasphaerochaeta coccoides DSM 17374]
MNTGKIRFIIGILFLFVSCAHVPAASVNDVYAPQDGKLAVRFLGLHKLGMKNGESTLIVTPGGTAILVDAGRREDHARLATMLETAGLKKLDYVIFTHFHGDHTGDFSRLAAAFAIGRVLMPRFDNYEGPELQRIMDAIQLRDIPYGYLAAGDRIELADGTTIEILHPTETTDYPDGVTGSQERTVFENQQSLVFSLRYGDHAFLFTGDIYKDTEYLLVRQYSDRLASDVLKAPHHGLGTSSSLQFLLAVRPLLTVVSSGEPTESTLSALRNRSRTLVTAAYGTILVTGDGHMLDVITEHEDATRGVYGE